ncbi:putative membrane protein YdjX (TVP38/TMEM64 family) [Allocatelliglobosispora scoriae]|uniref:Cytochrome c oxidase polypeptide 4 n=1 Tax=Allocatelliglobosispora scoriae TaxID=643052 RepID=A0A841BMI1_9ACTN|nr:cytochrome c oxidase subunit 4 [Allocatelliglobosispora scoriae]MBB5869474.1 putative membrane protein YdjX (TVP38/TMEM64 family) [Allocatelliglobosispora scoriae]
MKTEWRIFGGVSLFLFVMAVVYPWWTNHDLGHVDWVGTVALILSGLLCIMCGGYFWFVSRRIDPRPEDRHDGEIADGAGEIGFFSPGSYWPFGIALLASTTGIGLVFDMWWLVAVGLLGVVGTSSAMLFEYYTGTRRTAEH